VAVKTKWNVDFSFKVGTREVHDVHFHWDQGLGEAVMDVDGVEVLRERHFFAMKSTRRSKITVGTNESTR
jgi:hypothetical protein